MVRDVTERRFAEERLRSLHSLQRVVRTVNSLLLSSRSEEELLQTTCRVLKGLEFIDFVWIGMADEREGRMQPADWDGDGSVEGGKVI